jgi:hypothetical protein
MPGSLRVLCAPEFRSHEGRQIVLGGKLGLFRFGPGATIAVKDQPKAALLRFHLAEFAEIRGSTPRFQPFAELRGEVSLGAGGAPLFLLPTPATIEYFETPTRDERTFVRLNLDFSNESFANIPPKDSEARSLRLPELAEESQFVEVGIDLEISGTPEAAHTDNDVLDVALAPIGFFFARLEDDEGKPIAEHPFELEIPDGTTLTGTTESDGVVSVNPVLRGRCVLHLGSRAEESSS